MCDAHPELYRDAPPSLLPAVVAGDATRRAVSLLDGAGIRCAVLKGTAVAQLAWERPHLRPQADVDLLVDRADLRRAVAALRDGGLAGDTKLDGAHWHHIVLSTASAPGLPLELHHELSLDVPAAVHTAHLLSRRIAVPTPDGELPALAHEDAIVYLGLHAAVHAIERLSWLIDLAGYAERQSIDWQVAVERARSWGVALPVEIAWSSAAQLLDAQIPSEAIAGLGVPWARRLLSQSFLAGAHHTTGHTQLAFARSFRLSLSASRRQLQSTLRRKWQAREEGRGSGEL